VPITEHDRHVLALAVHVEADTIVTFSLRDFPAGACEPNGVLPNFVSQMQASLPNPTNLSPKPAAVPNSDARSIAQALPKRVASRSPLAISRPICTFETPRRDAASATLNSSPKTAYKNTLLTQLIICGGGLEQVI